MKTAIVFYSKHHGNTRKLVDAIKQSYPDVKLIDTAVSKVEELGAYDMIGVASGIYMSKMNKDLLEYLQRKLPEGKPVFALYTCGNMRDGYTKDLRDLVRSKSGEWLGEYGTFGYDTFGPFKLVGGLQKGHPTDEEIAGAVDFYRERATAFEAEQKAAGDDYDG